MLDLRFTSRCFDLVSDKTRYRDGFQLFTGVTDAAHHRQLTVRNFYILFHKNESIGEGFGPFSGDCQQDFQLIFKFDGLEILT